MDKTIQFPRAHLPASDVKQRTRTARNVARRAKRNPGAINEFCMPLETLCGSLTEINEGKRNAGRRGIPRPVRKRRTGRATERRLAPPFRYRARSPAGVPPRHLRQRPNATAQLQFTHILGRNYGRTGVIRPRPSQYSGRYEPAGRSSVPAGRFGPEPPESGVTTPPAGTASPLSAGVTRRRPYRARLCRM